MINWVKKLIRAVRNYETLQKIVDELVQEQQTVRETFQNVQNEIHNVQNEIQNAHSERKELREILQRQQEGRLEVPKLLVNEGILGYAPYLTSSCRKDTSDRDAFYYNIAEIFRGCEGGIYQELKMFLPYVVPASMKNPNKPFLDFGCGRGEFLDLLRENQIVPKGIDLNAESCQSAKERGHDVVVGDAMEYLKGQNDDTFAGISLIMVSEHLPFSVLYDGIFLFAKKIAFGGVLFINTINPYCYRRWGNFQLDPSHVTFLPPDIYRLIFEMAGFTDVKVIWSAPVDTLVEREGLHTAYENVSIVGYKADMELHEER